MNTTKQRIEALKESENRSEKLARILSGVIIAVLTIGGAWYCIKGALMQISANW